MEGQVKVTHDAEGRVFFPEHYEFHGQKCLHYTLLRKADLAEQAMLRKTVDGKHHYVRIVTIIDDLKYRDWCAFAQCHDKPSPLYGDNRADQLEEIYQHLSTVDGIKKSAIWPRLLYARAQRIAL